MLFQNLPSNQLHYAKFSLRPIEENDLDIVLKWRNTERIRINMYHDHLITKEEHGRWFQKLMSADDSQFLIFERGATPVGVVSFSQIDRKNGNGKWGFYIGEENMPKGTGFSMGVLGVNYAFEKMNLRKLSGEAFAFNASSILFHNRLGFRFEGQLRKHVLKQGKHEDVLLFALLREEWLEIKQSLENAAFGM